MKTQLALVGLLSMSLVYPLQANAGHPGGGGRAPAAHASAPAPHFEAPHAAPAPHFEAPHMSAPAAHFAAPHAIQQAPHFAAPRAMQQASHLEASHAMQAPRFEGARPEGARPMQQEAHLAAPHAMQGAPRAESRAFEPRQEERNALAQPHMAEHSNQSHTNAAGGFRARGEAGFEHGHELSRTGAPLENRGRNTAGEFGGHPEGRPIANAARFGALESHAENSVGRNRALGAAGGLAAGGLAAAALSHGVHNESGFGASHESGRIPGPPSYANPRHSLAPEIGRGLALSPHAAPNLTYGNGAREIPHIGDARSGRPGAIDPGGYIRNAREASPNINPAYARQQLAYGNNNYQQAAAFNARNIMGNRAAWPWQLPNYSAPWFGGWQGNWNWEPNWYSGGGGNPNWGWGNGWNNGGGFFGFLSGLSPWGSNSDLGWIPSLNYYNSYGWNGQNYPCDYYAANGFCPTPYVFNVNNGQFWNVGSGYSDYLPSDYHAPLTVAVQESVPNYSPNGQILGYQLQNFYYNAYWDQQAQNYGYYDYKQQFHWLTFPWNNAWNGNL